MSDQQQQSQQQQQQQQPQQGAVERIHLSPEEWSAVLRNDQGDPVLPVAIRVGEGQVLRSRFCSTFEDRYRALRTVHVCDFCFFFGINKEHLGEHVKHCRMYDPPGSEIYAFDGYVVYEVDGRLSQDYCEKIVKVARLFIENIATINGTQAFLFYVLCKVDEDNRCHFVGYFCKDKYIPYHHSIEDIFVLPGNKGCGRLLIAMSYEIARHHKIFIGPRRPMSPEGKTAFLSYWRSEMFRFFNREGGRTINENYLSVKEVSVATGIDEDSVIELCLHEKFLTKREAEKKGEALVKPVMNTVNLYVIDLMHKLAEPDRIEFRGAYFWYHPRELTVAIERQMEAEERARRAN